LYGFALDRNPFNAVDVKFRVRDADDPLAAAKRAFAEACGLAAEAAFPLYADRFADEMLQFLRMLCVTPDDLAAARVATLDDLDFSRRVSWDNEIRVLETVADACDAALADYPAADGAPAAGAPTSPAAGEPLLGLRNLRMANRLIATEKRILTLTIQAANRKIAELERAAAPLAA